MEKLTPAPALDWDAGLVFLARAVRQYGLPIVLQTLAGACDEEALKGLDSSSDTGHAAGWRRAANAIRAAIPK